MPVLMRCYRHGAPRPVPRNGWVGSPGRNNNLSCIGWISFPKAIKLISTIDENLIPQAVCYQGCLQPARVAAVRSKRLVQEKVQLRCFLTDMVEQQKQEPRFLEMANAVEPTAKSFTVNLEQNRSRPDELLVEFELDGMAIAPPNHIRSLVSSILQDLSAIPREYLIPAGDGEYLPDAAEPNRYPNDVWSGHYHEEGTYLYNEWDCQRQHYRKNWTVLRERYVHPQNEDFAAQTLKKYSGYAAQLRRSFEVLRGEERILKKQQQGEDVDIDAIVEAYGDYRSGMELGDRLYTRLQRVERNMAVMFMVDMGGSTKGWINDAEREALILLCEALEMLGDHYAIYGFSGFTRKKCELFRVKQFDEPYNDLVKARICGITPQDYTQMGVIIRHLSKLFDDIEARTKLLITLSDGKPDDLDGYRGEYGIEDTRKALIEAKCKGIHPYCITIDKEAADYLKYMYGPVNYSVIDNVRKLPLMVSDIYRKLTT